MFKKALSLLLALMLVVTSLSVAVISVSAADETLPEGTFCVVGDNAELFGAAWGDGRTAANAMTANDDGTYTKVYENVGPFDSVSLKVTDGTTWVGTAKGDNITFKVTQACDITVTYDPSISDGDQVTVTGEYVVFHDFNASLVEKMYAVGNGQNNYLNGVGWDDVFTNDLNVMEEVSEGVYEITFEDVDSFDNYQLKFAANGSWTDNFGIAKDGSVSVKYGEPVAATYDGDNITFEVEEAGSTVKLQLDISNFDYATGSGATFTITVIGPNGEEETTVTEEQQTDATEETEATETTEEISTTNAPAADKLTVTATSNITPSVTRTFDPETELITVTYWIQCFEKDMVNSQWYITYDKNVLEYDETDGVNQVYDRRGAVSNYLVFRATGGDSTQINTNPPLFPGGGIRGNASRLSGFYLSDDDGGRIPFVSVTFKPKEGATGNTEVNLNVEIMQVKGPEDAKEYYFINNSVIEDTNLKFMPEETPVAVYAGVTDPDYTDSEEQPTTAETEPTEETSEQTEPSSEETQPVDDTVFLVAGSANLVPSGWSADPAESDSIMVKQDDGTYKFTFKDVEPDPNGGLFQIKVVEVPNGDPDQAIWHGQDGTDLNVDFGVSSLTDVTVTYVPETGEIRVEGDGVIPPVYDIKDIYAVGNGQGSYLNGESWIQNAEANKMTEVEEGLYEITFEDVESYDNYQLKFAANGEWTINWGEAGGEAGKVNQTTPATYNGENIIFEVEEEGSTVKLQLDLRNFDALTKKGATYTITVTSGEDVPTTAPVTDNYLKVTATSNFFPQTVQTYYEGEGQALPEKVKVSFYMDTDKLQMINGQFELLYDPQVLVPLEADNKTGRNTSVAPAALASGAGIVVNYDYEVEGNLPINFTQYSGIYLEDEQGNPLPVIEVVFDVVGKGDTTVNLDTIKITCKDYETETDPDTWYEADRHNDNFNELTQKFYDESKSIYTVIYPDGNEPVVPTTTEEVPTTTEEVPTTTEEVPTTTEEVPTTTEEVPTTTEEVPTTTEEVPTTTEEVPTTTEEVTTIVNNPVVVHANSQVSAATTEVFTLTNGDTFEAKKGETVKVIYKLGTDKLIESIQWKATFDPSVLKFVSVDMPSIVDGSLYNTEGAENGVLQASASNINNPYDLGDDVLVEFTFEVVGDTVEDTNVLLDLTDILLRDVEVPTTEEPTTEEPTTEEPTTEEPTTEEPTTEEPTTAEPTTEEPTTAEPTTEEPTTAEPTGEQPTTAEPTGEQPTTAEPTGEQPTTVEPTGEQSTTVEPTGEQSTTVAPTTSKSTSDTPSSGNNSSSSGAVQTGSASMAVIILLVLVSATAAIYFARRRDRK